MDIKENSKSVVRFSSSEDFIKAGDRLIPISRVREVSLEQLEDEIVDIHTYDAEMFRAQGFDAIELILRLKPSALEGRRLKWRKHAWAVHNLAGHVGMQCLVWLGFKKAAIRWHDHTTPTIRDYIGRR